MAVPAVEFDRPHLDAGENAVRVLDIEIILVPAVLLADRDVKDMIAERARVIPLHKAFLRAPLPPEDAPGRSARLVREPTRHAAGQQSTTEPVDGLRFAANSA